MSLIQCPECGIKISDKATRCPHCGFESADSSRPISEQDKYEIVPIFEYEIEEWNPNRGDLSVISYEDNKNLIEYFGDWKNIQAKLPDIARVIKSLAKKEHIMVAKMDSYVKDLIDKGIYKFNIDKAGEILPTISDGKGFVKQVRLEDMSFSPSVAQSLSNLSMHAVMAQILDEIEYVGDAIKELHVELQNDRYAMVESSRDKLKQSRMIQDSSIRKIALLEVVNSATDAKRTLMRNFTQNMNYIESNSKKTIWQLIGTSKGDNSQKANDAFQSLVYITNSVQTECEGYAMMGEYEPCRECLIEFKSFIEENKLDQRDTLLLINENLEQEKKNIEIVDGFSDIAERITTFDTSTNQIENSIRGLLTGDSEDGGGVDE